MLLSYSDILSNLEGTFSTGLSSDQLSALARMAVAGLDDWEVKSYTVSYSSTGLMPTASTGTERLYIVWPDEASVEHASAMISKMSSNALLTDEDLTTLAE